MTELCGESGISPKTGYKILKRYGEEGPEGLRDPNAGAASSSEPDTARDRGFDPPIAEGLSDSGDRRRSGEDGACGSPSSTLPETTVIPLAPWISDLQGRFREVLGTKVQVKNGENYRGQIVIHYHDRQELDRLCETLAPREEL